MAKRILSIMCALAVIGAWTACDDGGDGDGDADVDGDVDGDADTDVDEDSDAPTILTSTHSGWQQPTCLASGCHTTDAHNDGMLPYECVACHGKNGAERGHTSSCGGSTAGTGTCHAGEHGGEAEGFPAGHCGPCHQ